MKSRLQSIRELESWHENKDPWNYDGNDFDTLRRQVLLDEISKKEYNNVLDIGCGQGFITKKLKGKKVTGIDISQQAIKHANSINQSEVEFLQCSIFDITNVFQEKFDLILITGVLYSQYIGKSSNLIYTLVDQVLEKDGHLLCVHIKEWYNCNFPYLKLKEINYPYRDYDHKLELYIK